MVLANELLDNLPFGIVVRTATGWDEVRVGVAATGFVEVLVPAASDLAELASRRSTRRRARGSRSPPARSPWIAAARGASAPRLRSLLVDYTATGAELVERGRRVAAHLRGHARGAPADAPGEPGHHRRRPLEYAAHGPPRAGFDVALEADAGRVVARLGIDELVAEGRARGRPAADAATSRRCRSQPGPEAAALTDPAGLGAHTVLRG